MLQSTGPEPYLSGVIHQETTTVTSNTTLAETMTNLIGVFIVAWDGNPFSVVLVVGPLSIDQAQSSRCISQGIQLQQYPRTSDTSLASIRPLTGCSLLFPCSTSAKHCSSYGARFQSSV